MASIALCTVQIDHSWSSTKSRVSLKRIKRRQRSPCTLISRANADGTKQSLAPEWLLCCVLCCARFDPNLCVTSSAFTQLHRSLRRWVECTEGKVQTGGPLMNSPSLSLRSLRSLRCRPLTYLLIYLLAKGKPTTYVKRKWLLFLYN